MKEFKHALYEVKTGGYYVPPARENMPNTIYKNSMNMKFQFQDGFPILTSKRVPFYSMAGELMAFMKGITDVREFDQLGTKVWWDNAYKWKIAENLNAPSITKEEYKDKNNWNSLSDDLYDLGAIYSYQWRSYGHDFDVDECGNIDHRYMDQLSNMIKNIKNNPYSRYHNMTAWNPMEMNNKDVSQPNCHVYFQANCSPINNGTGFHKVPLFNKLSKFLGEDTVNQLIGLGYNPKSYLDTHLTQRSADMFLGVPFNISSYSLFTILLGLFTNTLPREFAWTGVNSHIYENHMGQVNEYLKNPMYPNPKLYVRPDITLDYIEKNINTIDDVKENFKLINYNHSGDIKAPLSVGL